MIKKYIQLLSNGSVNIVSKSTYNKQFNIYKKDHINFFLNKKQKIQYNKSFDSSVKFKNQYLKF